MKPLLFADIAASKRASLRRISTNTTLGLSLCLKPAPNNSVRLVLERVESAVKQIDRRLQISGVEPDSMNPMLQLRCAYSMVNSLLTVFKSGMLPLHNSQHRSPAVDC